MPKALIGRKIGMTRLFDAAGKNVPVTVIQAGPCFISQVKTAATDGYDAVQLAFEDVKPRNSTVPLIGHDAKAGIASKRFHREIRLAADEVGALAAGQQVTVEIFDAIKFVDVIATSKGKGMQGVMRRWGFKGLCASHGTERKHRSPGSISGRATNRGYSGRPKKGVHMAGHWGVEQVTVRSLPVLGIDKVNNLLLVKGPVPGPDKGVLMVREAVRLYKSKARVAKAS